MPQENKQIFVNRLKSFVWRAGMMLAIMVVSFFGDNLALFHLAPGFVVVIGLVLGEVTKFINQKLNP